MSKHDRWFWGVLTAFCVWQALGFAITIWFNGLLGIGWAIVGTIAIVLAKPPQNGR